MEDNHDLNALDWLVDEIEESLSQSRKALEAFVDDPQDNTRLRFCLTHLHQVHGSLKMMELDSASLLADEMEQLCQDLLNGKLEADKLAIDALMRALIQLPQFLHQMRLDHSFHSALVFPLVNELRAAQGRSLLIDSLAFDPDLSALTQIIGNTPKIAEHDQQFIDISKKLQKMFQFAAANALRGINVDENREYINKAFLRLKAISQGSSGFHLWDVAKAWLDTLSDDDLANGLAVKALMRHLHREMKQLVSLGTAQLKARISVELLRTLLFYIACSESEKDPVKIVKRRFKLATAFGDGVDINASNADQVNAIQSVSLVIKEELEQIKQVLGQLEHEQGLSPEIERIPDIYRRVADTMSVMGIADMPEQLQQQSVKLQQGINDNLISEDLIIDLAQHLIEVEQKLDVIAATGKVDAKLDESAMQAIRIDDAQRAVVAQALPALEQVKQCIVEYIASQWEIEHLEKTPALLREIAGGIGIIPLPRSSAILSTAAIYIEQKLLSSTVGASQWLELDTLADAISSVEYYLERLRGNGEESDDQLLDIAEKSLASLGYNVDDDYGTETEQPKLSVEPEPMAASAAVNIDVDQNDDDEIDEEIREIFVEEAAEVIAAIEVHFPRWAANFEDEEALTEFRRAFHTLKGSGRVVKASTVSELAWAVENLLNRVLERSIPANLAQVELIDQVRVLLPGLMSDFEHRRDSANLSEVEQLQVFAGQLADGIVPAELERDVIDVGLLAAEAPIDDSSLSEELQEQYQLWDIFVTEAQGHVATAKQFIEQSQSQVPDYQAPSDAMQRALHTLKGSAHMAAVTAIAELATPLEGLAKEMRNYQVPMNDDSLKLFSDACSYICQGLEQISARQDIVIPEREVFLARVAEQYELNVGLLINSASNSAELSADPAKLLEFMSSGADLLFEADRLLENWRCGGPKPDTLGFQLELDTLTQAAEAAKLPKISNLSQPLAKIYAQLDSDSRLSEPQFNLLQAAHEDILAALDSVAATQEIRQTDETLIEQLQQLRCQLEQSESSSNPAGAIVEQLTADDEQELILASEFKLEDALAQPLMGSEAESLVESEAEPLIESEAESLVEPEAEPLIESEAESLVEPGAEPLIESEAEPLVESEAEQLEESEAESLVEPEAEPLVESEAEQLEESEAESLVEPEAEPLIESEAEPLVESEAEPLIESEAEPLVESEAEPLVESEAEQLEESEAEPLIESEADQLAEPETELIPRSVEDVIGSFASVIKQDTASVISLSDSTEGDDSEEDELDPEILEIFEEEASEQLESLEELVHAWEEAPDQSQHADELNRVLHTLKGGARLAGLMDIGDLAHDFETYIASVQDQPKASVFVELHGYQDRLISLLRKRFAPAAEAVAIESANALVEAMIEPEQPQTGLASVMQSTAQPESATVLAAQRSAPQELVKIPAELLEELVNLAGETSITRGRMEQQVSDWGMSLEEMNATILRLQEQLRRLDIETEAQVLFRQEQLQQLGDFDPLEMDRYSQLQQLSRSLAESASDLMDLKNTLTDKSRDTETLLLQQSRINTELQEGLMRSRMVPFSRMVPRLRRIVRQVASELDKQISFEMENVEGELDRSVLERMLSPLEHMLRNAVDHGIESRAERAAAGKSEVGHVTLSLAREGGDVLLRLSDDGNGIDVNKVKEKAIQQGLMKAESLLSDKDILEFVLHSGLSTAESVTQISGRGVGLDVVGSEIKALGGSVSINTELGRGTEFVVRLPFTVSVNRALMVNIDDDSYAIPLNTIEGIVRVSPFELEHYYQDPQSRFEYAGEDYKVRYLGEMLNTGAQPKLEDQILPLPVVLVRTQEHVVAIQVDSLAGSREIVVKSLGLQFAGVQGLSGATVTGDGSVVVIIDPIALIRRQQVLNYMHQPKQLMNTTPAIEEEPLILVVDDSVTVRKVTSRLLEREGYRVATAKDGIDALHQLQQEELPSIMLLDIEMPRMDGFEVAKNVRSSRRLKNLPIIMITSRTGAKHQEHALELGVNDYMGKPYQEDALLENITKLLDLESEQ